MHPEIEQAISLLQQGDDASFNKALALLQDTIFSFSMRVCGQRQDAEDTMQEVLVKSLPLLSKFDSPKALLVWLYKVAKTRCLMSRRRSKFAPREDLSLDELMPDRKELEELGSETINPESFAIRGEQAARLREAVQKLPPQYRIVLVLRDMEGLNDDDVAEITGLRSGTVRVRLHRARLFVRNELMKIWKPRDGKHQSASTHMPHAPEHGRCKALFAELSNYLDEQMDDSLCEDLERHLSGCEPCKVFLATLEASIEQCRKSPAECPNGKTAEKLRKSLLQRYKRVGAQVKGRSAAQS
jgi:RNA polymerase sigma-70 factor (ECF subfamily)